jgi:class 3 adenylate cyclase
VRHLRRSDKALLVGLVGLWAACFALSLRSAVVGAGFPPVLVSAAAGAEDHPVVSGFSLPSGRESGLRVGDRLLRLGNADLRGVGLVGFFARAAEQAGPERVVSVAFERAGERGETSLRLGSYALTWPLLLVSVAFAASGVVLLLRALPSPLVRAWFEALLCIAIALASRFGASRWEVYASTGIFVAVATLFAPLSLRALLSYTPDAPRTGWLLRVGPWLFGPLVLLFLLGLVPYDFFFRSLYALLLLLGVAFLVLATRIYRGLDPIGRRQAKWVLLGGYCALVPRLAVAAWVAVEPSLVQGAIFRLSYLALLCVPISLLIAIGRYNLFDVDRLLSATASYNLLLVALLAGALVGVPRVAVAASRVVGIDPGTVQVALALALAALVVPAHRRLRPRIDRLFFKQRYALDRGIGELLPALASCADARELTGRVGEALHRLFRPESCVVYGRVGESYVPIFVQGRAVPPAFGAASPLVGTLAEREGPLALSDAGRRPHQATLGPFDRAALETLAAEVVVPVRGRQALAAFVCLGPRRSGDVYTSTDLSLLLAVAETVSRELRRFDQEETLRHAREMQDSLRRYVPGAVAEVLASGAELGASRREVSVLFVDLRGYTSFAEPRRADEIFSTVNRYTETVSELVRKHGGSVVEFNGDGMMAVFGAPRELPYKERAAVQAGREIVTAVAALPIAPANAGEARLSVGVGIATGEAFVGSIHAADRMIWSAIGNPTNLAARLQALSRDLDASVVIDAATWRELGPAGGDLRRHSGVAIRGRQRVEDVYALPLR